MPQFSSLHDAGRTRARSGDPKARIGRSGCAPTTVELPPGNAPEDLELLRIQCRAAEPAEGEAPVARPRARIEAVPQVFLLDAGYRPGTSLISWHQRRTLRPGESVTLVIR